MNFQRHGVVLGLAALLVTSAQVANAADTEVTVAANGGKIENVVRDIVAPAFQKQTGVKLNFVAGLSGEILSKVQVQRSHPQIDVAIFVPLDVERAKERGLIEPVNTKIIPNLAKVDAKYVPVAGYGVPLFGYVIAPAYNTKMFAQAHLHPIQSWNDLTKPIYGGRTTFSNITNDWAFATLVGLAKANGGSATNLAPGFKAAQKLAAVSTTFYKNSTQMMPVWRAGGAMVGVLGSFVTADLGASGVPIKMAIPKEGAPLQAFTATVIKHAPHLSAAEKFVNFMASPFAQQAIANAGFYPVVKGMQIAPKYRAIVGLPKNANVYRSDLVKEAPERAAASDRWNREVTPMLGKMVRK